MMTKSATSRARGRCGLVALMAAAPITGAMSASPSAAQDASDDHVLDEIIVTATKRDANLQQVPISVTAVDADTFAVYAVGGEDIRLLSARIPNLNVESTFGRTYPRFYIRGLGNSDFALNAQQSVELYYDEVPLVNPFIKGTPVFDIERIEVLRGPQGTLWGRNATAGAVHVVSKKPTDEFEAAGRFSYGRLGTINAEAVVSGALVSDTLSGRIAVLYQSQNDWVENLVTGNQVGAYTDVAARAQLLWTPRDDLSALLQATTRSFDGVAALFHSTALDPVFGQQAFEQDKITLDNDRVPDQEIDTIGINLRVDYDFDTLTLTSITSFITADAVTIGDVDATGIPALINTDAIDDLDQYVLEVRLASDGGERFRWQVGGNYFRERIDYTNATANDSFQVPDPPGPFDLGQPGDPGFGAVQFVEQDLESWALFGQAEYDLLDRLTVVAGLRYTSDSTDASRVVGQFTPDPNNLGGIPDFTTPFYAPENNRGLISLFGAPINQSNSIESDEITWDVSLNFAATDDINLYGRVARGYHGGVIVAGGPFSPFDDAGPETILSYEVGAKTLLLDGRVRANLSLFRYNFDDQQLQGFVNTPDGGFTAQTFNAPGGTGQGFELELEVRVLEGLTLSGNVGYVDTEIDGPALFATSTGDIVDLDGRRFAFAPEITAAILAEYAAPIGGAGHEFYLSTDWSYRGEVDARFTAVEEPRFTIDGFWEGGARLGVRNQTYDVSLWARNIAAKTGSTSVLSVIGFDSHSFNNPRVYGVDLSLRF